MRPNPHVVIGALLALLAFTASAKVIIVNTTNNTSPGAGETNLGSFLDNGPLDLDPAAGTFDFDIRALNIPINTLVTVAANYSADPPGTPNGRTHTSCFAMPITLLPAPRITINELGLNAVITRPTNSGSLKIQSATNLGPSNWIDANPPPDVHRVGTNFQTSLPISATNLFFRLAR